VTVLQFPDDRIVGQLSFGDSRNRWFGAGFATGVVEVPADHKVRLDAAELTVVEPTPDWNANTRRARRALDLSFLRYLPSDSIFSLHLSWGVDPETFEAVEHLADGLTDLCLGFTELEDRALSVVARLSRLTDLQTFGNKFTDEGTQQLRSLVLMNDLMLEEETLTAAAFDFVSQLPRLTRLGVWDVQMTDTERVDLQARLPGVYLC
jgi:hypothetical protein